MCYLLSYIERIIIVISNIEFIIPCIYLINSTINNNLIWYNHSIEIFTLISTCIFSSLYHLCSNGNICTSYCIISFNTLHILDFLFSYQILCLLPIYNIFNKYFLYKLLYFIIIFILNLLYLVQTNRNIITDFYWLCFLLNIIILILLYRFNYIINIINKKYIFIFILALICKFYFDNKPWYIYSFGHSLWHFLIGLGLYYYYSICDSQILYNEYGEIELL